MATEEHIAIVEKVEPKGEHGPYAITSCDEYEGSVTFSLKKPVWKEDSWPEPGTYVLLSAIREKRSGFRAMSARFKPPSRRASAQSNSKSKEQH